MIEITDYLAAMTARVKAGTATREEQEAVAKAMRAEVDEANAAYIRKMNDALAMPI
jgi:Arc/MetJ family transcription regulator